MLGLTSCLRLGRRECAIGSAIAAIIMLTIWAPSAAHASGCENSWTNTKGGSWFEAENWSKKAVPTSGEEVCITEAGTYSVTMTQTSSTVTIKALTVGAATGKQTLVVGSSASLNAILTTTAGLTNGAQGAITLTNGDGAGNSVTIAGAINNAGTITTEVEHGGLRQLQGNLTNTGTLALNASTQFNGSKLLLTNEGALNVAEGKQLTVSEKSSITNGAGGKIAAGLTGNVLLEPGSTFTEGAGTTSGTLPVIIRDGALAYSGSGSSVIAQRGESSTLSGSLSSGQSLLIQSTASEHVKDTAAASFTNGGSITLTNGDGSGNNATLVISSGTLTNAGTIATEVAHGGQRSLQGNITNTGTLEINTSTSYNGASTSLTNEGALNVAEGKQLTVSEKSSITNGAGGKIAAGSTGVVTLEPGATFTEGAGTTSGTLPVVVRDGALSYTGSGLSTIALRGESSTLSGSLSSGQLLLIESTTSEHAKTTAGASFTNGGTITLTNGDGSGNNATLVISSGTLTNSGKLATEVNHGGVRALQGNITNTGTLGIGANTAYNGLKGVLINEGTLNVAEGKELTVSNGSSVTNGTGGKIITSGGSNVFLSGGTFTEGAGTTSGPKPVIIDDGTLSYTGEGKSQIALHGSSSLSGNLVAGQSLSIESTCGEHAVATAVASFTSGGAITLTNGDGCGNNATLATSSGTFTNAGQLNSELDHGGARTIDGNLTNTGTVSINTNTSYPVAGATLQNKGAIDIAETVTFSVTGPATVTNGAGGMISGGNSGSLVQTGGTFNEGAGASVGKQPVILDDLTLNYSEHGSGPIQLRGTSTMSGAVRSEQTLAVASTCSEHAVATAASFINNGTIELTNGDGCGDNATLNMKGGTLTNHEKLTVANLHGGVRTIEGNLINQALLRLEAGQTLHVTGNFTQASIGRTKTLIASSSSFGSLSVSGTATLGGTLVVHPIESFKASLEQKFAILTSAALTGAFASESEDQINSTGLYYKPSYSSTGVTLAVTQAALVLSTKSGAPGSSVTISGSGYLPGDTVTPTFTDRNGVKTVFTGATVNGSGEFSTEIMIPATAALGAGIINMTSTGTGVHINNPFKVT